MKTLKRGLRRLREMANEPSRAKRGWVWTTNTAIIGLICVVVFGSASYVSHEADQREAQLQDLERFRCEQRVESREQLRGVLVGLAFRLGADDETLDIVIDFIDSEYPALDKDDCLITPITTETN